MSNMGLVVRYLAIMVIELEKDVMDCVRKLLSLYRTYPCLYEETQDSKTLEWINRYDSIRSTISFIRRNPWNYNQALIVVCNFSPVPFDDYTFGVPVSCTCKEVFITYDTPIDV